MYVLTYYVLTYYVLTRYKVPATEQFGKSKELKKAGATRMGTNTWCPVGVVRMMGTGALEPVVGLREQRRRKIAEVEAAAVAAAERDAAAARGDAEEELAASPEALALPAADSAGAAVQTALERVVAACALAGLELSLGDG